MPLLKAIDHSPLGPGDLRCCPDSREAGERGEKVCCAAKKTPLPSLATSGRTQRPAGR